MVEEQPTPWWARTLSWSARWPVPRAARRAMAEVAVGRAGLLDGLSGPARGRRAALLAALYDDGMPLDEMRRAVDDAELTAVALRRAVAPIRPRHTLDDIAERTGTAPPALRRWYRAFERTVTDDPTDRIYTEDDLDLARRFDDYRRLGLTERDMLPVARAVGRGVTSMADAIAAIVGDRLLSGGEPDLSDALGYAVAIRRIARRDGLHLAHLLAQGLAERIGSHVVALGDRSPDAVPGLQVVAVGFADIAGFTELGEQVGAAELSELADLLAETTAEVLVAPTRLTKTIGDAVMLVSPDPAALVRTVVGLAADWHHPDATAPPLRVGLAWGSAVPHAGDWFGPSVNLASRITAAARPGTVVADVDLRDACGELPDVRWGPPRVRRFKGVPGSRRLHRAQAATP